MVVVGLTGGIGSGKSTVSALLGEKGAVVVDADVIAREVLAAGGPAHQDVVDRFGSAILSPDGGIDRPALARIVFSDPLARADLNALTHPAIRAVMDERIAAHQGTDHVVVADIPLLVESSEGRGLLAGVIVVDTPAEVAVERLVSQRGMDRTDAEARVAAQAGRDRRLARADWVVTNGGTRAELADQVDRAWEWIAELGSAAVRSEGATPPP